jgi:hypothetical protein
VGTAGKALEQAELECKHCITRQLHCVQCSLINMQCIS